MTIYYILLALIKLKDSNITLVYMRIKSSNKIKLDSILSAQNVKCKVTKGRQILSGHPNLTFATTLLVLLKIYRRRRCNVIIVLVPYRELAGVLIG